MNSPADSGRWNGVQDQPSDLSTLRWTSGIVTEVNSGRNFLLMAVMLVFGTACGSTSNPTSASFLPSESSTSIWLVPEEQSQTSTSISANSEDVVALAFDALMARRIECGRRPKGCEVSTIAESASPLFVRLTSLMEERLRAGITASRRGSVRYRIDDVEMKTNDEAVVTTCLTDDTVLMSAGAIFNDSLYSAITQWIMRRSDRGWLWIEDQVLDWRTGEDLCAFDK